MASCAFCWAFQAIANGKCNQDSENYGLLWQSVSIARDNLRRAAIATLVAYIGSVMA